MASETVGNREDVEQARRRFEEFRQAHAVRSRLPEELWATAAKFCVGWMLDCATFSLGCRLPSTASVKVSLLCSAVSQVLRDSLTAPLRTRPPCGFSPLRTGMPARQTLWRSPGSRACCFSTCQGLRPRRVPSRLAILSLNGYCLPIKQTRSAHGPSVIGAQSPGPPMPLSTLRRTPRDAPRKTRGRNRVGCSFPVVGLFHPLQHAGLFPAHLIASIACLRFTGIISIKPLPLRRK